MLIPRLIPSLLIQDGSLVKTVNFKARHYVGDPLNAVRIFNEKEVDELLLIDIGAAKDRTDPPWELLESVTAECFMPLAYGGGIQSIATMRRLFGLGIEKVLLGSAAGENPELITEAAAEFGAQAIVVAVDVGLAHWWSTKASVLIHGGKHSTASDPIAYSQEMVRRGAGEILLMDIKRDGMAQGLNLELIRAVSQAVSVPIIAAGGVGTLGDARAGLLAGASAVAVGGLVVLFGRQRAVLINYPQRGELEREFQGLISPR